MFLDCDLKAAADATSEEKLVQCFVQQNIFTFHCPNPLSHYVPKAQLCSSPGTAGATAKRLAANVGDGVIAQETQGDGWLCGIKVNAEIFDLLAQPIGWIEV